jgi:hypothetical protein
MMGPALGPTPGHPDHLSATLEQMNRMDLLGGKSRSLLAATLPEIRAEDRGAPFSRTAPPGADLKRRRY